MGSRVNGVLTTASGFIIALVGYGMYKSPHLDWEGFIYQIQGSFQAVIALINHFIEDPFSLLGAIVLISGIVILFKGVKTLIFG